MTIQLEGLAWAQVLVGAPFPQADEDALRRCAQAWRDAAAQLRRLPAEATQLGADVRSALHGDAADRFTASWRPFAQPDGTLGQLADACDLVADACEHAATEVEYAKLAFLVALAVLAATLAALAVAMAGTGGASGLAIPFAIATAQLTIRAVLARLLLSVLLGAATNAAMDLTVQVGQLIRGTRDGWDAGRTAIAAGDGALYGAVAGGVLLGGAALRPGVAMSGWGILGGLGVSGLLGAAAVTLAHGQRLDATELLLGLTSGVVGGLGPGLIAGPSAGPGGWHPASDGWQLAPDGWQWAGAVDAGGLQGAVGGPASDGAPVLAGWGASGPSTPGGSTVDGGLPAGGSTAQGALPSTTPPTPPSAAHVPPTTGTTHPPLVAAAPTPAATSPVGAAAAAPALGPAPGTAATASAAAGTPPLAGPSTMAGATPAGAGQSPGAGASLGGGPSVGVGPSVGAPSAGAPTPLGQASNTGPVVSAPASGPAVGPASANPTAVLAPGVVVTGPSTTSPGQAGLPGQAAPPAQTAQPGQAGPGQAGPGQVGSPSLDGAGSETTSPDGIAEPSAGPVALTDAEAMDRARQSVFRTPAGFGFYLPGDDNRLFASAIQPTPGFVTIDIHGNPRGFTIDEGRLSPGQFATALRELMSTGDVRIGPGEGIRLISCDTADGGSGSPAAVLARELGVDVLAPDRVVWTAIDGEEIVASPRLVDGVFLPVDPPDGRWHRFTPDGELPEGADAVWP